MAGETEPGKFAVVFGYLATGTEGIAVDGMIGYRLGW
jgi:hypothetical protein